MFDLLRNAYEDLKSMDNVKIEKMKRDSKILKLQQEKQRLISFLKDLIEETECAYDYKENDYKNSGKWNLLNEILDFVNKGGKDE